MRLYNIFHLSFLIDVVHCTNSNDSCSRVPIRLSELRSSVIFCKFLHFIITFLKENTRLSNSFEYFVVLRSFEIPLARRIICRGLQQISYLYILKQICTTSLEKIYYKNIQSIHIDIYIKRSFLPFLVSFLVTLAFFIISHPVVKTFTTWALMHWYSWFRITGI